MKAKFLIEWNYRWLLVFSHWLLKPLNTMEKTQEILISLLLFICVCIFSQQSGIKKQANMIFDVKQTFVRILDVPSNLWNAGCWVMHSFLFCFVFHVRWGRLRCSSGVASSQWRVCSKHELCPNWCSQKSLRFVFYFLPLFFINSPKPRALGCLPYDLRVAFRSTGRSVCSFGS